MLPLTVVSGSFRQVVCSPPSLLLLLPPALLSVPPQAMLPIQVPAEPASLASHGGGTGGKSHPLPPLALLRDQHGCAWGQGWLRRSGMGKGSWVAEFQGACTPREMQFAHLHPILPVGPAAPGCLCTGLWQARRRSRLPLAPGSMAKPMDLYPQLQKSGCHRRIDLPAVPRAAPAPAPPSHRLPLASSARPRGTLPALEGSAPTCALQVTVTFRGQTALTAALCPARAGDLHTFTSRPNRAITYSHTGGATMGCPTVEGWGGGSHTRTLAVQPMLPPF